HPRGFLDSSRGFLDSSRGLHELQHVASSNQGITSGTRLALPGVTVHTRVHARGRGRFSAAATTDRGSGIQPTMYASPNPTSASLACLIGLAGLCLHAAASASAQTAPDS